MEIPLKFSLPTGKTRIYKVNQNLIIQDFMDKNFPESSTYDNFILYNGKTQMDKKAAFVKFNLKPNQTIIVKRLIKVTYGSRTYDVYIEKYEGYLKNTIITLLKDVITFPNFELKLGSNVISDTASVNTDAVSVKNPYTLTYVETSETFNNVVPYEPGSNIGTQLNPHHIDIPMDKSQYAVRVKINGGNALLKILINETTTFNDLIEVVKKNYRDYNDFTIKIENYPIKPEAKVSFYVAKSKSQNILINFYPE